MRSPQSTPSNLWAQLSAREVQIERVEGDKDVMNGAGDVPYPDGDGPPDASVQGGRLDASAFDVSKSVL